MVGRTDVNYVEQMLDEADLMSTAACEHFDTAKDLERQKTYSAHIDLQRAILLGTDAALESARQKLSPKDDKDPLIQFINDFPKPAAIESAYRVAVWLKWLYWARSARTAMPAAVSKSVASWLPQLETLLVEGQVPSLHPYEQLLGYMALLAEQQAPGRERILEQLAPARFETGLVRAIALIFRAQLDYEASGCVEQAIIQAAYDNLPPRIAREWGEAKMLESFAAGARLFPKGPLTLLPFHYS